MGNVIPGVGNCRVPVASNEIVGDIEDHSRYNQYLYDVFLPKWPHSNSRLSERGGGGGGRRGGSDVLLGQRTIPATNQYLYDVFLPKWPHSNSGLRERERE